MTCVEPLTDSGLRGRLARDAVRTFPVAVLQRSGLFSLRRFSFQERLRYGDTHFW